MLCPSLFSFGFSCLKVSSMSNFRPDTRGQMWSLIWTHLFSCALGRVEPCKQLSLVCVGSACSVWTTLGLPKLTACAFWFYTAQAAGCSAGHCPKRDLGFMHFSGLIHSGSGSQALHRAQTLLGMRFVPFPGLSSSGDQVLGQHTVPGEPCVLITSPVLAAWFPGGTT